MTKPFELLDLLHRASCEIEQLRRKNEVLAAKVWAFELVEKLLPKAGRGERCVEADIAWRLKMTIEEIRNNATTKEETRAEETRDPETDFERFNPESEENDD